MRTPKYTEFMSLSRRWHIAVSQEMTSTMSLNSGSGCETSCMTLMKFTGSGVILFRDIMVGFAK